MTTLLIVTTIMSLIFAGGNYYRAEIERKTRLNFEEESSIFHQVLLEHLTEWKMMQDQRDMAEKTCRILGRRYAILKETMQFIADRPAHPRLMDNMIEIPGENCQRARDALSQIIGVS